MRVSYSLAGFIEVADDQRAMIPVLLEERAEIDEQLFRGFGGKAETTQARDELLLPDHVPLALGDMIIDHLKVGYAISHGRP